VVAAAPAALAVLCARATLQSHDALDVDLGLDRRLLIGHVVTAFQLLDLAISTLTAIPTSRYEAPDPFARPPTHAPQSALGQTPHADQPIAGAERATAALILDIGHAADDAPRRHPRIGGRQSVAPEHVAGPRPALAPVHDDRSSGADEGPHLGAAGALGGDEPDARRRLDRRPHRVAVDWQPQLLRAGEAVAEQASHDIRFCRAAAGLVGHGLLDCPLVDDRWATSLVATVDAGGLILRVEADTDTDAELVRRVVGAAITDAPPHAVLKIGAEAPTLPSRPPDFAGPYGNHWDDGTTHWFAHDWGLAARVTAGEAVLGGDAAGYRRWVAVRNSMLFVLARLLLAQDRFLLHGAAVRRDERALLVVGESGAGKSSLAYAAHLAGWQVLGDDMVAVEAAGGLHVRGIPRVPTLPGDVAAGTAGEPLPHDPRRRLELPDFALDRRDAPITGVLICRHDDGAGRLAVTAATEAVEALVPAFVLSALPRPVTRWFPLATRLARGPTFWFGHAADDGTRLVRAGELLGEALATIAVTHS
jgi:hypothetical protein